MKSFILENVFSFIGLMIIGVRVIIVKTRKQSIYMLITESYPDMSNEELTRTLQSYKEQYESQAPGKLKVVQSEPLVIERDQYSLVGLVFSLCVLGVCLSISVLGAFVAPIFLFMDVPIEDITPVLIGFAPFFMISCAVIYKVVPKIIWDIKHIWSNKKYMTLDDFGVLIEERPYPTVESQFIDFHKMKTLDFKQCQETGRSVLICYDQHDEEHELDSGSISELEWLRMTLMIRSECARRGIKGNELPSHLN